LTLIASALVTRDRRVSGTAGLRANEDEVHASDIVANRVSQPVSSPSYNNSMSAHREGYHVA